MTQLFLIKENVKTFIGRFEVYLKPLGKFLLALITLMMINGSLGYMGKIDRMAIVLMVALMCSFMPMNFIIVCAGLFILLHFYALSLECALVGLIIFLVLALVYFRFAPKGTILVLFIPIFFVLKIPYLIPICAGLLSTPVASVAVAVGVIIYYTIHFVADNNQAITALEAADMSGRFRYLVDGLLKNKAMVVFMLGFAITVIIVYLVRRLPVDHSWTIAIAVGTILQIVILMLGVLTMDVEGISSASVLVGSLVAVPFAFVVKFCAFELDYSRTENVQFEDDEYYYYVKAVPKVTVSRPSKTVKKINSSRKRRAK